MSNIEPMKGSKTTGVIACPLCREDMPVKENQLGTLSICCPWCGSSGYAKKGTQAHEIVSGWMHQGDEPQAGAATAANDETKPRIWGRK